MFQPGGGVLEDGKAADLALVGVKPVLRRQVAIDAGSNGCIDEVDLRGCIGDVGRVDECVLTLERCGEVGNRGVVDFLDGDLCGEGAVRALTG
jgi:hypothetical protein